MSAELLDAMVEGKRLLRQQDELDAQAQTLRQIAARNPIVWPFAPFVAVLYFIGVRMLRSMARDVIRELERHQRGV